MGKFNRGGKGKNRVMESERKRTETPQDARNGREGESRPTPRWTPGEYRRALLMERRRTMRTVRNSLLVIALIAGIWFLILSARERVTREKESFPLPDAPPAFVEEVPDGDVPSGTTETPETANP